MDLATIFVLLGFLAIAATVFAVRYRNNGESADPAEAARIAKEEALLLKQRGRLVASDNWNFTKVSIFDKGYVEIGTSTEKLLGISGDAQVTRKSGLGRSVATLATFATPFPAFNLLSPDQRGNCYLAITTDQKTHFFKTDVPFDHHIKAVQTLVAAGNAVLQQINNNPSSEESSPRDLAEQLKELSTLHEQGALNKNEFERAKAKLIGGDS